MKRLLIVALTIAGISGAAAADDRALYVFGNLMAHADSAFMDAEPGQEILLNFDASPRIIEQVADKLRERGYVLDEEAYLLNPDVLHVLRYKGTTPHFYDFA